MTAIKIVSRWNSNEVLFEHQTTEERQASGLAVRDALEAACKAGANLAGAYLAGAYLAGAYLAGANLAGANLAEASLARANLDRANLDRANLDRAYLAGASLAGANLDRAYLDRANLDRANLDRANLAGANLDRAYLDRANLAGANLAGAYLAGADGEKLTLLGNRPVLQIGPIGSRCALLSLYLTDAGPMVRAGCFWGTLVAFEDRCGQTHGDNEHGKEYDFAALLMRAHAELWTPTKDHP